MATTEIRGRGGPSLIAGRDRPGQTVPPATGQCLLTVRIFRAIRIRLASRRRIQRKRFCNFFFFLERNVFSFADFPDYSVFAIARKQRMRELHSRGERSAISKWRIFLAISIPICRR